MLSELLDELMEDSPFLRNLTQEAQAKGQAKGMAEGRLEEQRMFVRDLMRARYPGILPDELTSLDTLTDAKALHALMLALASATDEAAARRALADALE